MGFQMATSGDAKNISGKPNARQVRCYEKRETGAFCTHATSVFCGILFYRIM